MTPAQRAAMEQRLADGNYDRLPTDAADLRLCLDHIAALKAVLRELVYLKDFIHDTPEYERRKEPAWQAARDMLPPAQAEG